jgi:hypothetical protein
MFPLICVLQPKPTKGNFSAAVWSVCVFEKAISFSKWKGNSKSALMDRNTQKVEMENRD